MKDKLVEKALNRLAESMDAAESVDARLNAEAEFTVAANTKCCDEWPECTHILAAWEKLHPLSIAPPPAPSEPTTDIQDVIEWLDDRRMNCLRVAAMKTGADADGWIGDAQRFADSIRLLQAAPTPATPKGNEEPLFYIQDARGYCGNSVTWWCPNGKGYTPDLNKAWKVLGSWRGRDTDQLWPCAAVDAQAQTHFDMQNLRGISRPVRYEKETQG